MRRTVSFFIGLFSGAMVGVAAALLLAPYSGSELQNRVRSRAEELIEEGKRAAAARRIELETQLEAFKRGAAPAAVEVPVEQS
jgi:gas vesicle protein